MFFRRPSRFCVPRLSRRLASRLLRDRCSFDGNGWQGWHPNAAETKQVSCVKMKILKSREDGNAKFQALEANSLWFGVMLPAALAPASLSLSEYRWIFEDFVHLPGVGSLGIGLPGVVSLGIFLNPMIEAMPRICKLGHVGDMPMLPYSAMASQGSVWTAYGLLLGNPAVWTPNFMAALLGMYYMRIYCKHCDVGHLLKSHIVKVLATMGFSVFAYTFLPHDVALNLLGITGNVMTIFMFGGPLAAIRTVIREQNTRALNLGFTCIVNLNCFLWFFYAYFMLDDPYIYLQDGIGIILATLQLGLFARYGIQRH